MTRYERVLAKYDWAKKHVYDLETAVLEWRSTNRYAIRREDEPQRSRATFYVDAVPDIPPAISLKIGDALHNLRSALDHLAWALVEAARGTLDQHTSFPIFDTPEAYKSMSPGRVKGIGNYCMREIDRIAPYKGGLGNWAWQLHKLDIANKHRLLLTVASVPIGRTMMPSEKAAFNNRQTLIGPNTHFAMQLIGVADTPPLRPVQTGDVLGTFPLSEMQEEMGFAFDIAIDEPEFVSLIPTFMLLRFWAGEVGNVISELSRFL